MESFTCLQVPLQTIIVINYILYLTLTFNMHSAYLSVIYLLLIINTM